jgi:formimidoylglutamate deiminase
MTRLWFHRAMLSDGWATSVRLTLRQGRIEAVEAGVQPQAGDERHEIGLPGLPNLHSHAFQRAMAGRAERRTDAADDFWLWRTRMYELAGVVEPQDLQAIAALAYAEMLQAGFVRVGEFHYLHNARDGQAYDDPGEMAASLAAAAAETGIGLTLLPVFYAHSGFGSLAPTEGQARFLKDLDGYARLLDASRRAIAQLPGAVLGVAPHSLRAVTPDELRAVAALAPQGPIHIHIAEQQKEVDDCLAWSGRRPIAWLLDNAQIDGRWCLVHATHADAAELAGLAKCGTVVGLCPITEANLGDGLFAAERFLQAGGRFGVGSDSNVLIDAAEELRLLEYGQRLSLRGRNLLAADPQEPTADQLYRAARTGGVQALGCEALELRVGAPASLISLRADHPSLIESSTAEILSRWIFAAAGGGVDSVWVAGQKAVADGRHLRWDAILADYRQAIGRINRALAA